MANPPDHNDMLALAGRQVLSPLGLKRKGRSRIWLDDRGLWLFFVEFQPSAWSKGSYLNVGASWLWKADDDFLSFDIFKRAGGFADVEDGKDFLPEAIRLAKLAAAEITTFREQLTSLEDILRHIEREKETNWTLYSTGIVCGLLGLVEASRRAFQRVISLPVEHDWQRTLRARAIRLESFVDDQSLFREAIFQTVASARARGNLPPIEAL